MVTTIVNLTKSVTLTIEALAYLTTVKLVTGNAVILSEVSLLLDEFVSFCLPVTFAQLGIVPLVPIFANIVKTT